MCKSEGFEERNPGIQESKELLTLFRIPRIPEFLGFLATVRLTSAGIAERESFAESGEGIGASPDEGARSGGRPE